MGGGMGGGGGGGLVLDKSVDSEKYKSPDETLVPFTLA